MNKENQYKGFSLFNDQEEPLRSRNRACVISNIAEDNMSKDKKISPRGAALMIGYFNEIPKDERQLAAKAVADAMNNRGFAIVNE